MIITRMLRMIMIVIVGMLMLIIFIIRAKLILIIIVIYKVPVYKALEKRWNHWDDLENDPRYFKSYLICISIRFSVFF